MSSFELRFGASKSRSNSDLVVVNAEIFLVSTNTNLPTHRCDWENMVGYSFREKDGSFTAGVITDSPVDGLWDKPLKTGFSSSDLAIEAVKRAYIQNSDLRQYLVDRFDRFDISSAWKN